MKDKKSSMRKEKPTNTQTGYYNQNVKVENLDQYQPMMQHQNPSCQYNSYGSLQMPNLRQSLHISTTVDVTNLPSTISPIQDHVNLPELQYEMIRPEDYNSLMNQQETVYFDANYPINEQMYANNNSYDTYNMQQNLTIQTQSNVNTNFNFGTYETGNIYPSNNSPNSGPPNPSTHFTDL